MGIKTANGGRGNVEKTCYQITFFTQSYFMLLQNKIYSNFTLKARIMLNSSSVALQQVCKAAPSQIRFFCATLRCQNKKEMANYTRKMKCSHGCIRVLIWCLSLSRCINIMLSQRNSFKLLLLLFILKLHLVFEKRRH